MIIILEEQIKSFSERINKILDKFDANIDNKIYY